MDFRVASSKRVPGVSLPGRAGGRAPSQLVGAVSALPGFHR